MSRERYRCGNEQRRWTCGTGTRLASLHIAQLADSSCEKDGRNLGDGLSRVSPFTKTLVPPDLRPRDSDEVSAPRGTQPWSRASSHEEAPCESGNVVVSTATAALERRLGRVDFFDQAVVVDRDGRVLASLGPDPEPFYQLATCLFTVLYETRMTEDPHTPMTCTLECDERTLVGCKSGVFFVLVAPTRGAVAPDRLKALLALVADCERNFGGGFAMTNESGAFVRARAPVATSRLLEALARSTETRPRRLVVKGGTAVFTFEFPPPEDVVIRFDRLDGEVVRSQVATLRPANVRTEPVGLAPEVVVVLKPVTDGEHRRCLVTDAFGRVTKRASRFLGPRVVASHLRASKPVALQGFAVADNALLVVSEGAVSEVERRLLAAWLDAFIDRIAWVVDDFTTDAAALVGDVDAWLRPPSEREGDDRV